MPDSVYMLRNVHHLISHSPVRKAAVLPTLWMVALRHRVGSLAQCGTAELGEEARLGLRLFHPRVSPAASLLWSLTYSV